MNLLSIVAYYPCRMLCHRPSHLRFSVTNVTIRPLPLIIELFSLSYIHRTGEPGRALLGGALPRTNSNSLTFRSGPYTMPPQPGVFPLPYASTHKARANPTESHNGTTDVVTTYLPPPHHTIHHTSSALLPGPSSRPHGAFTLHSRDAHLISLIHHISGANIDDGKKDRRRKEIVGRLGKEMNDRRDECVSPLPAPSSHACLNR